MRHTQDLKDFVSRWSGRDPPSKEILYEYMPLCRGLLYEDEELVRDVVGILQRNIEVWAAQNSEVYSSAGGKVVSKDDLWDAPRWHAKSVAGESMHMATNGSTTGRPFPYLRWEPFLYPIEAENHYDLIMDEFGIPDTPEVMYFFRTSRHDPSRTVTVRSDSDNFMEHHGLKRRANVHYVNFDRFENDRESYVQELIGYLSENRMDVIFAPGPSINSICHHIRKTGLRSAKLCRLMSNSNERLLQDDAAFLLDGLVDDVCDHMRCWDGGASFFTCRHRNYHLLDNLSWCEDVEGKLVSTDYFSLPSPFVRYWNGDFCQIADTYSRCECGRLYRDFEFLENRPFALKGRSILDIQQAIESSGMRGVTQVRCSSDHVEIVSRLPVQEGHRQFLRNKFRFNFRFVVEK